MKLCPDCQAAIDALNAELANRRAARTAAIGGQVGRPRVYPFDEIEAGDMVAIPFRDHYQRRSIQSSVRYFSRLTGRRFTTQSEAGNLYVTRTS